jgi:NTP pyrophosphatase (non-canonical NTP hydrolase)
MNRTEHLLTKLMEECAEVAQEASKASIFGLQEVMPGQPLTNRERVQKELNDLWAVCEMLLLTTVDRDAIEAKKAKVEKYMEYARSIGTLVDEVAATESRGAGKGKDA